MMEAMKYDVNLSIQKLSRIGAKGVSVGNSAVWNHMREMKDMRKIVAERDEELEYNGHAWHQFIFIRPQIIRRALIKLIEINPF